MTATRQLDPRTAYLVESDEDRTALIALRARISNKGVEWFDTVRDRGFYLEELTQLGEVTIARTKNATYRFRALTIELYREKVQPKVMGKPDFESTEDLQAFYESRVE
ncbi:MAG: hypothetical protein HY791_03410 [Deltaproteobacteria bacterium]|nr:hypothetical protein [Deltaproteobacteria bacterium]